MQDQSEITESDLCIACGMCCDNTLFGRVVVEKDEAEVLTDLEFEITEYDDGELSFDQPCPRLCDKKCEVYKDRPWTCQSYNCVTITKWRDGEISAEMAAANVAEALQAKEDLLELIGEKDHFTLRRDIAKKMAKSGHKLPSYAPQVEKLERILDEHFRTEDYWMVLGTQGHAE